MQKKIGIITHYYKSLNYGGNLQAYALCEFLNKQDVVAEQISFSGNFMSMEIVHKKRGIQFLKAGILKVFGYPFRKYRTWRLNKEETKQQIKDRRRAAFFAFNQEVIRHSKSVYDMQTLKNCTNDYEVFITGSDQVWNMRWYNSAYFLDFVPSQKIKISYAASIGSDRIDDENRKLIEKSLADFRAISVREENAIDLIQQLVSVQPYCVLDPTLLLTVEDWEKVREELPIANRYIFCYYLGNNIKARKIAKQFARNKGLLVVTIPHATGDIEFSDLNFGDQKLYDASPQQFLSLIKNAEYIFTDSFHAVVFSFLYRKQYFVFNRTKDKAMSTRIKSITKLFNSENHFCGDEKMEKLSYILRLQEIDYEKENEEFEKKKLFSMEYLRNNIKS